MHTHPESRKHNIDDGNMKGYTGTMDDRPYHHGNLKAALVAAGIEILATDGIPGLSLRAIAARVGVSHAAPRNHFGSLRALLSAIAAEGFTRHRRALLGDLPPDAPHRARFDAAMQGYVAFAAEHPALFDLMFSPVQCDFDDPALTAAAAASYDVLRGIATGLIWDKADLPDAQARAETYIWSLVHGYATLAQAGLFKEGSPGHAMLSLTDIMPQLEFRDTPPAEAPDRTEQTP